MDRRNFIRSAAVTAAVVGTSDLSAAAEHLATVGEAPERLPLLASAPMLQNFAETSIGVAFAVNDLANGYVLIGEKPDLSDARKVLCGGHRLADIDDRVIQVRVTGLKPATKYYYRIGADRIHYGGGYDMKVIGNEEDPRVYSFTTAGEDRNGKFCVINDTHVRWDAIGPELDKIAEIAPACVIWNGDASNTEEKLENLVTIYLNHPLDRKDYAAEMPYLFSPGNHDFRGWANRHLERVWMYRQPEERAPRDWDLGRNFAVRLGEVALIGLDTAEDKLDTNPRFAGLFKSAAYREAQTAWLKDVLADPRIASAPYLVAICHIPLFDDDPAHNPGDVFPDDTDPRYTTDYAYWQRTCGNMWGPLLHEAGCQVLVAGHLHRYRYYAPAADRCWAQVVGGGYDMKMGTGFPTVIEGEVREDKLCLTVHNIFSGQVQDVFAFAPRK